MFSPGSPHSPETGSGDQVDWDLFEFKVGLSTWSQRLVEEERLLFT